MKTNDIILKGLRKCYFSITKIYHRPQNYILDRQQSNDMIYELLIKDEPCMIS